MVINIGSIDESQDEKKKAKHAAEEDLCLKGGFFNARRSGRHIIITTRKAYKYSLKSTTESKLEHFIFLRLIQRAIRANTRKQYMS